MDGGFAAGLAELLEFEPRLERLLVLCRMVVDLAAVCALEFDQVVL
jgi:hypothetical protein